MWGSTCLLWVYPEIGQGAAIMTNSASSEGAIRFQILLSIAAEYGWPLTVLPVNLVDLVVVVAANLYNLLMTAIFLTRPRGWKRFERIAGLLMVALAHWSQVKASMNLSSRTTVVEMVDAFVCA